MLDAPKAHLVFRASFVFLEPLIQHADRAKEGLYLGLLWKIGKRGARHTEGDQGDMVSVLVVVSCLEA